MTVYWKFTRMVKGFLTLNRSIKSLSLKKQGPDEMTRKAGTEPVFPIMPVVMYYRTTVKNIIPGKKIGIFFVNS